MTLDPAGVNAGGVTFQDQAYTLIGSTLNLATASGRRTDDHGRLRQQEQSTHSIAGEAGLTVPGPGPADFRRREPLFRHHVD